MFRGVLVALRILAGVSDDTFEQRNAWAQFHLCVVCNVVEADRQCANLPVFRAVEPFLGSPCADVVAVALLCASSVCDRGGDPEALFSAVVGAMARFPGDFSVQSAACKLLSAMASSCDVADLVLREPVALEQLVALVERPALSGDACMLLLQSSYGDGDRKDRIIASGATDAVMERMAASVASSALQSAGCVFLASVAHGNSDRKKRLLQGGASARVVEALRGHPHAIDVQTNGWTALACLAFSDSAAFFDAGVVGLLEAALEDHAAHATVLRFAFSALSYLVVGKGDHKDAIMKTDIPRRVVEAIHHFPCDEQLRSFGTRALSSLAYGELRRKSALISLGVVEALLDVFETDDANTLEQAFECMRALSFGTSKRLVERGAVGAVFDALKRHASVVAVHGKGMRLLFHLAHGDAEHKDTVMALAGFVPALFDLMDRFRECPSVQTFGCKVVSTLSHSRSADSSAPLWDRVDAVLNAMRYHARNEAVQVSACKALFFLTHVDHDRRADVVERGVVALLTKPVHGHSSDLKNATNELIASLASISNDSAKRMVEQGVLDIVPVSFLMPPEDAQLGVQVRACFALRMLCRADDATRRTIRKKCLSTAIALSKSQELGTFEEILRVQVGHLLMALRDPGGLDLVALRCLPESGPSANGVGECSVCISDLHADNQRVRTLPCMHVFHSGCITEWLANDSRCPICKGDIKRLFEETQALVGECDMS